MSKRALRINSDQSLAQSVKGSATNDSAAAGFIGEEITASLASGSATSLTTATAKTITSIALTAGDWDIYGIVDYILSSATASLFRHGSSQTNNTLGAADSFAGIPLITTTLSATLSEVIPCVRVSLSGAATLYLIGEATFSAGTVTAYGTIRARRRR